MLRITITLIFALLSLSSFSQTSFIEYYGPHFITKTEGKLGFPRYTYQGRILNDNDLARILGNNSSSASYYSAYALANKKASRFRGFGLIGGILSSGHDYEAAKNMVLALNSFNKDVERKRKKKKDIEMVSDAIEEKVKNEPTPKPKGGSPFPYRPPVSPK